MKKCPFCAEEIQDEAIKCRYCGELLQIKSPLINSTIIPNQKFSYYQPIYHLVILSIASFGFYLIYWFYRNWNHIKIHKNLSIRPWLRTLGFFVPVLNLFLLGKQFYYVKTLKEEAQIEKSFSPGWNLVFSFFLFFLSALFHNMLKSGKDDSLLFYYFILSYLFLFFSFYPFIVVQRILNLYWSKVQPELIIRTRISIGEIALSVAVSPVVWILASYFIVVTFLLPKMPETEKSTNTEQSFIFKDEEEQSDEVPHTTRSENTKKPDAFVFVWGYNNQTITLWDGRRSRHCVIGITFETEDELTIHEVLPPRESLIKGLVRTTISSKSIEQLNNPLFQEDTLKSELLVKVNEILPEGKRIRRIFIDSFIIQ